VSVGSFSGGGYQPTPGQPPPAKPVTPNALKNVLVKLVYDQGSSKPFRVKELIDLGNDPAMNATRVLLDGEIPAWGKWTQSGSERQFEITSTNQLPGLTKPAQTPLPGYKDVKLLSDADNNAAAPAKSGISVWVWVAVGAGVLALVAVLIVVLRGRKTPA
jgi:hypothetical protein